MSYLMGTQATIRAGAPVPPVNFMGITKSELPVMGI
jgi:hypothetical protein